MLTFASYAKAYSRLDSTVCLYDGKPVYLTGFLEGLHTAKQFNATPSQGGTWLFGKEFRIDYDSPLLNATDFKLGFMTHENKLVYLYRKVAQQWKLGVTNSNTGYKVLTSDDAETKSPLSDVTVSLLFTEMENEQKEDKTYEEACNLMLGDTQVGAAVINRDVALLRDTTNQQVFLFHKMTRVGFVHPNNKRVQLFSTERCALSRRFLESKGIQTQ